MGLVHIAPAAAAGAVVYWTPTNGSALKGFQAGSNNVSTLITPASFLAPDSETCVGCHTASPDGQYVFLTRGSGQHLFGVDVRDVSTGLRAPSTVVSDNAISNLLRHNQTLPALSPAHFSDTDAFTVTTYDDGSGVYQLVWTDLHATAGGTGVITRKNDPGQAATPVWSHDGRTIAYTSSSFVLDGRLTDQPADVYTVPWNGGIGGNAKPLPGASDSATNEYYPIFSPDDKYVAFDRAPIGNMYSEPTAELWLVAAAGGASQRLAANDPPMCTGVASPGVSNSWPKFAPQAVTVGATTYYWVVFSSTRQGSLPQLYIAGITETGGQVTSYPAIWVTSQDPTEGNHTPAWDYFNIIN
jgi:hypothetical protein